MAQYKARLLIVDVSFAEEATTLHVSMLNYHEQHGAGDLAIAAASAISHPTAHVYLVFIRGQINLSLLIEG